MRSRVPCEPPWYVGQSALRHEENLLKARQESGCLALPSRSTGVAEREAGPTFRHLLDGDISGNAFCRCR